MLRALLFFIHYNHKLHPALLLLLEDVLEMRPLHSTTRAHRGAATRSAASAATPFAVALFAPVVLLVVVGKVFTAAFFVALFLSFLAVASAGVSPGTGPKRGGRSVSSVSVLSHAAKAAPLPTASLPQNSCDQGFWLLSGPAASSTSERDFFHGGATGDGGGGGGGDFGGVNALGGHAGVGGGGCAMPSTPTRLAHSAARVWAFVVSSDDKVATAPPAGGGRGCDHAAQLAASWSSSSQFGCMARCRDALRGRLADPLEDAAPSA